MKPKRNKEIIVSMTSYPKRIDKINVALDSIFSQTVKPDKIILWLAKSEFINKEKDLPQYLLDLQQKNKIFIEWCDNLKPHKKYFYALKKYKNSIIITVDDDLIYEKDFVECLINSYKKFPYAISALRTHIMNKKGNEFVSYKDFKKEQNDIINIPSMQLLATTGGGTLFPPNIFNFELFDKNIIKNLCIHTDDLFLKVLEAISDIPVVQPRKFGKLKYVKGTQEDGLWRNYNKTGNDEDLKKLKLWADDLFEKEYIINKIFKDKLYNNKTVLYFIPHQDDELLTMGIDICNSINKGDDVHVILCTDGSGSRIRKDLKKGKIDKNKISYDLSEKEFVKARDKEFIDSCLALGVKRYNIHIPYARIADKTLSIKKAENLLHRYLSLFGYDSKVCTIYYNNGKNQHSDHKNLGYAANNLFKKGYIEELCFFREPYNKSKKKSFKQLLSKTSFENKINNAISAYSYWNPDEGRFAIGHHSVRKEFENYKSNMTNFYFNKRHTFLISYFYKHFNKHFRKELFMKQN